MNGRSGTKKNATLLVLDFHKRSLFDGVNELWDDMPTLAINLLCLAESLVSAATHMLARGKLHMDIKGDNVRFSAIGEPVLVDFGSCVGYSPVKDSVVLPPTLTGNLAHLVHRVHLRKPAATGRLRVGSQHKIP